VEGRNGRRGVEEKEDSREKLREEKPIDSRKKEKVDSKFLLSSLQG